MRGKKRWLELGKDLIIALLAASALGLLWLSPLVRGSGLPERLKGSGTEGGGSAVSLQALSAAAIPLRMTVGTGLGRYGAQYDQAAVDALFDVAGPLLGEALGSAAAPQPLPERGALSWRSLLAGEHVYFGYAEPIPLDVLRAWVKPDAGGTAPEGTARHILLAAQADGMLVLCYRDQAGDSYLCATGLDAALHLAPILERVTPNSALFAFEDRSLPAVLDPYTLITGQDLHVPVYHGSPAVSPGDAAQVSQLLSALSFSDLNRAAGSDASTIYVDGDDTLRLYANGLVRCHAGPGRYEAGPGLSGAVEAAWALAGSALGPLGGEARLYLVSAREEGGVFSVTFGYSLNGSTVYLPEQGWCAQFTVQDGAVTDFLLRPRAYASAGYETLLLPAGAAAAALTSVIDERGGALSSGNDETRELVVQYLDGGDGEALPRWVGR